MSCGRARMPALATAWSAVAVRRFTQQSRPAAVDRQVVKELGHIYIFKLPFLDVGHKKIYNIKHKEDRFAVPVRRKKQFCVLCHQFFSRRDMACVIFLKSFMCIRGFLDDDSITTISLQSGNRWSLSRLCRYQPHVDALGSFQTPGMLRCFFFLPGVAVISANGFCFLYTRHMHPDLVRQLEMFLSKQIYYQQKIGDTKWLWMQKAAIAGSEQ